MDLFIFLIVGWIMCAYVGTDTYAYDCGSFMNLCEYAASFIKLYTWNMFRLLCVNYESTELPNFNKGRKKETSNIIFPLSSFGLIYLHFNLVLHFTQIQVI